ncbi:hypothetical protein Golob_013163, partial [Gossypium lobatum]|nr:hypothetical protein [Gossypium lobatum]
GLEGLSGYSISSNGPFIQERKVHQLWTIDRTRWNKNRVIEIYGNCIVERICNLPIIPNGSKDCKERAITLSKDFCIHNMVNKSMLPLSPSLKKWENPLRGTVKINFDATVSNTKTGFGVIAFDSEGFFIRGGFGFKNEKMTSDWVELYAFEESL